MRSLTPWFERRPDLLRREERAIASRYPNLHFVPVDDEIRVRGGFPVRVGDVVVDHLQVELLLAEDHPTGVPVAAEIGGRIPWIPECHVNRDGQLCLFLPEDAPKFWPPGCTVQSFLDGPVNSFFVGYLHYRTTGRWPFGERAHGIDGILDFYKEKTGLESPVTIATVLQRLSRGTLKGHLPCVCGSSEILRRCHPAALALARELPRRVAAASLKRLLAEAATAGPGSRLHDLHLLLTNLVGSASSS